VFVFYQLLSLVGGGSIERQASPLPLSLDFFSFFSFSLFVFFFFLLFLFFSFRAPSLLHTAYHTVRRYKEQTQPKTKELKGNKQKQNKQNKQNKTMIQWKGHAQQKKNKKNN
jgi:Sec-independent protein translocase protein TatA